MPRYYRKKEDFKIVSKEEIEKLINSTEDEELRHLLMLSWLTGARISELLELKYDNISFDKNGITIAIKAKKRGKMGYPSFSYQDPFIAELVKFFENRRNFEKFFKRSKRRYQQLLLDLNKKVFGEAKENYITFHYLRHSRLSYLARRLGATPEELKSWTGHRSSAFEEYFAPRRVLRFRGKIR